MYIGVYKIARVKKQQQRQQQQKNETQSDDLYKLETKQNSNKKIINIFATMHCLMKSRVIKMYHKN